MAKPIVLFQISPFLVEFSNTISPLSIVGDKFTLANLSLEQEAMSEQIEKTEDNSGVDVIATVALITLVVLGTIHFVYTGGLPAFLDLLF